MPVTTDERPRYQQFPWEQWPGEPGLWYGRFCLYRDLGPGRSMTAASRAERHAKHKHPWPPNESWYQAAAAWHWRERALAWDEHQRQLLTLCEYNIRLAARDRRVAITEEGIDLAREGIDLANLPGMTREEARRIFPQLRRFLTDMLKAQRKEFEISIADEPAPARPISADDLRAAMRQLEQEEQAHWGDQPPFAADWPPGAGASPALRPPRDTRLRLFVCPALGDAAGPLDPDAMRGLGLRICRISEAHRTKFCEAFGRERTLRRPIELLHLELRTTAEGIEFANGLTRPGWRVRHSEHLRIVVLGRYAGTSVQGSPDRPAWCAAVPHLITLGEEMPADAARTFTETFWQAVAAGKPPAAAVQGALDAIAPAAHQYVSAHLAAHTNGLVDEDLAGNAASDVVDGAYNR